MGLTFVSLLGIVAVAMLAPLLSWVTPRRFIPETVLLIAGGMLIGPNVLAIAAPESAIHFLHELGMAFLFLMAGYEIDINELRGSGGRHAMLAWCGSLTLAFAAVAALGVSGGALSANGVAVAIAMTSTAIGTILPILRERNLLSTAVGASILNHGAVGEVGPIILMALLLGSRATWKSVAILLVFLAIAVLIIRFTDNVRRFGMTIVDAIHLGASTTAQTTIRLTVVLLVGLCTLAAAFQLDVVLGAFAAGFILRYAVPDGSEELEEKLDGLAYGFFVPIFFVTSGMAIDVDLSRSALTTLAIFLVLLVAVRGVPVWLATWMERRWDGSRAYSLRQCIQVAVYSTTALPIIVAVTQVAVGSGAMSSSFASTLVLAGAVSVLLMPALALLFGASADLAPAVEALAIVQGPVDADGHLHTAQAAKPGGDSPALDNLAVTEPRRPASPPDDAAMRDMQAEAGAEGEQTGQTGTQPRMDDGKRAGVVGAAQTVGISGTGAAPAAPSSPAAAAPTHRKRRMSITRHGLTEEEARFLAERLARIEAERIQWRQQMRQQRNLDREEAQQRRALRRALSRERRREERDQVRQLKACIHARTAHTDANRPGEQPSDQHTTGSTQEETGAPTSSGRA